MKKRIWEGCKTLLILVLVATLLLLTFAAMPRDLVRSTPWLSTVLQPLAPVLGLPEAELAYVEDAQPVLDAAQPLSISLQTPSGRYTAKWSFAALDSAYEQLGSLLARALDTAGAFVDVRADRLPQALSQPSICFDYGFALPVELLASWLEAAPTQSGITGRMFILAAEEDQVKLYLSGDPCRCALTDVSAGELTEVLDQFKADGSRFAFEAESHLASLALIPGTDPIIPAAVSDSPCDNRYIESLATALGFNPYDENRYTDSAGVTHFSETNCSLQVAASGRIRLSSTSIDRFQADSDSIDVLVETARSQLQVAAGSFLGDTRLYLSGVTRQEGETVCTFDYVLSGIPVACGNGPAAVVTFSGRAMTSLELLAAVFSTTGEPLKILPPAQAAAIVPKGSDLTLQYHRAGTGELAAGWVK